MFVSLTLYSKSALRLLLSVFDTVNKIDMVPFVGLLGVVKSEVVVPAKAKPIMYTSNISVVSLFFKFKAPNAFFPLIFFA